jgi:hypothetical protein
MAAEPSSQLATFCLRLLGREASYDSATCPSTRASIINLASISCSNVIPIDNILFASEPPCAARPEAGHYFNDTKRYTDRNTNFKAADRAKIFESKAPRCSSASQRRYESRAMRHVSSGIAKGEFQN